jgi:hypothetical protein
LPALQQTKAAQPLSSRIDSRQDDPKEVIIAQHLVGALQTSLVVAHMIPGKVSQWLSVVAHMALLQ